MAPSFLGHPLYSEQRFNNLKVGVNGVIGTDRKSEESFLHK